MSEKVKRKQYHIGLLESELMTSKVMVAPQFEDTKSEQYRYVFATGVLGGVQPDDALIIFWLDRLELETVNTPQPGTAKLKKISRELQVEVHMTPAQFKKVATWMNKNVENYEKIFGKILTPEEIAKKGKKPPPSTMIT